MVLGVPILKCLTVYVDLQDISQYEDIGLV